MEKGLRELKKTLMGDDCSWNYSRKRGFYKKKSKAKYFLLITDTETGEEKAKPFRLVKELQEYILGMYGYPISTVVLLRTMRKFPEQEHTLQLGSDKLTFRIKP
jgi:hypothetical protein